MGPCYGLNDYVEVNTDNTNPNNKDTDTDGFEDNFELTNQTSPTSSASTPQMGLAMEISEYASSLSVDITVQSPVGGLLAIEQSENLQDWTSIELFEGNGRTISRVFPREDNASAFYRVRLLDQTP
ncbi:MAG: hypothetical protein CNE95_06145 [Puniceicoccaceae bacterium MED-G30]|nr:MAG: hypothetical protein CNE95_06145 [Puniceicoccaceae bacterium MED-G30]